MAILHQTSKSWNQFWKGAEDHENYEEVRDQLYELKFTEEELEAHMSLGPNIKSLFRLAWLIWWVFDKWTLWNNTKIDDRRRIRIS